jgi:hypothetical protein
VSEPLTDEQARQVWADFRDNACRHCGGSHPRACPRVRRLEFHQNGNIASVEFWPPGKWPDEDVLWPEQLPPDPDME